MILTTHGRPSIAETQPDIVEKKLTRPQKSLTGLQMDFFRTFIYKFKKQCPCKEPKIALTHWIHYNGSIFILDQV